MIRKFHVYELNRYEETIDEETYVNELSPRENMITSYLIHHHVGNILNERDRIRAAKHISGHECWRLMYEIGERTFVSENLRN